MTAVMARIHVQLAATVTELRVRQDVVRKNQQFAAVQTLSMDVVQMVKLVLQDPITLDVQACVSADHSDPMERLAML